MLFASLIILAVSAMVAGAAFQIGATFWGVFHLAGCAVMFHVTDQLVRLTRRHQCRRHRDHEE